MQSKIKIAVFTLLLTLVFVPAVYAEPESNPNFPTRDEVEMWLGDLEDSIFDYIDGLPEFQGVLDDLASRVGMLEGLMDDLSARVGENEEDIAGLEKPYVPILPNAPYFKEYTFMKWYIPSAGATSSVDDLDTTGYKYMWFAWNCGHDAKLTVEYSNDGTNWFVQLYKTPEECGAGGHTRFYTMGRYYRVVVGETSEPSQFVTAQGRYYR